MTTTNRWVFYMEIIAVYYENYMTRMQSSLAAKQEMHIAATVLQARTGHKCRDIYLNMARLFERSSECQEHFATTGRRLKA
jgi:hypothetical protein